MPLSGRRSGRVGWRGDAAARQRDRRAAAEQSGDAFTGTILLIEDITERIRLEEQLQISEKMASIGLLAAGRGPE